MAENLKERCVEMDGRSRAPASTSSVDSKSRGRLSLLLLVFHVLLDRFLRIAVGLLRGAGDLISHPLRLLLLAVDGLARRFLNLARGFLNATFNLIFVDTHLASPAIKRR